MTDDYLAVSNTGKNITITMTPGMKQRILGDGDRIGLRFVRSANTVLLSVVGPSTGYKFFRRKNVWNMSVASNRLRLWPVHDRIVFALSQVHMNAVGAMITLPKPAVDDFDSKTIAEFQRSGFHLGRPSPPIRIDHPAMNRPEPRRDEPAKRAEYINLAGEYFDVLVNSEDHARFWKAYLRTLEKTEARHLFIVPDMVVAAITGACGGFIIALMLAAAGVLK